MLGNVESDILSELNTVFSTNITQFHKVVKSNIAIASAITSYARIHMLKYKLSDSVYYTDTDSIFTSKPLPAYMVGDALEQMKDEMKGILIDRAYFLEIKNYAYQFTNNLGKTITKSVFAGVERDSVKWSQVIALFKGETIEINIDSLPRKAIAKRKGGEIIFLNNNL